ncbi:unnamed protein product [Mytilus edulis]|uniref:Histidine N-acetyltransferase C-terminal domain-containing protein n=1 Tax=Mytilus edulis TaxID=6550 RepID=A0A8S3V842_MYTED|nr:unnamed protein product [Mytilus edulis]
MSEYILIRGISSQGTSWTFLDSAVEEFGCNSRTELYGTGLTSVRRRITSKLIFEFYDTHKRTLQNKYTVIRKDNPSLISESIDKKVLCEILASTDHKQYLFPQDGIVVDQVPYMTIKSNAPLIISKRTTVVVSDLICPQRKLLSISNFFQAPIGMVFNFIVYGCVSENFKEHLILHFAKFLCRPMSDYILFRGILIKGTSWTFLDSTVEDLDLKEQSFMEQV